MKHADSAVVETTGSYTARETAPDRWRVFQTGQSASVAGPFDSSAAASEWIRVHGVEKGDRVRVRRSGKLGTVVSTRHGMVVVQLPAQLALGHSTTEEGPHEVVGPDEVEKIKESVVLPHMSFKSFLQQQ